MQGLILKDITAVLVNWNEKTVAQPFHAVAVSVDLGIIANTDSVRWISVIRLPDFMIKTHFDWAVVRPHARKI